MVRPFFREYRQLPVLVPFSPPVLAVVSVKDYQNVAPSTGGAPIKADAAIRAVKDSVVIKFNAEKLKAGMTFGASSAIIPVGFTTASIQDAHTGKGSPEDIATTLGLVAWYGLGPYIDYTKDTQQKLQDYVDKYIGLDCNGFAGNYARRCKSSLTGNSHISLFSPPKLRRRSVDEIRPGDAIVWCPKKVIRQVVVKDKNGNSHTEEKEIDNWPHVAIVDDAGGDRLYVVESSADVGADGLTESSYALTAPATGSDVFHVTPWRRSDPVRVYIAGPLSAI
jgi:hypothetical protein